MKTRIATVIVLGMLCSTIFAQPTRSGATTTRQQQSVEASNRRAGAAQQPANNNDAASAAQVMQRNGGSLLKATLAAPTDPAQASLAAVSFFAVPEPEPRVIKKHDLVTIIIREESEFTSEGTTETSRQAALEARIDEFIRISKLRLTGGGIDVTNPPAISANGSREFTGEGTVELSDSLTVRITAEVLDVKPNGTLVLKGRKDIQVADEFQRFLVSGVCRAQDVTADNTVLSTQLKDFDLRKTQKGSVRNATKRGWATKLLDAINPF
jgi:flagellar L-ring protein precursor FlgH